MTRIVEKNLNEHISQENAAYRKIIADTVKDERGKTSAHTFTLHTDPGHGWLEVDFSFLRALGLNPTDFSRFSYRRRNVFYLEEDCDAPKFLAAYEKKNGAPAIKRTYAENTFIRNLPSIW